MEAYVQILTGRIVRTIIQGRRVSFFVTDDGDLIQSYHAKGEFYESEELALIANYFEGGCFIDVGANIGNHSIYAGLFLSPTRIVCIEPNPEVIPVLRANIQLNDLEIVERRYLSLGLSDVSGLASLHQPQQHNAGAMQLRLGGGSIRLATGDDLFQLEVPSFLKIDVEGMELRVLGGLEHLIERCSPRMFIEVDNNNRESFDAWCASHSYVVVDKYRRYPQNENFLIIKA
jgi:FkbM family methyltransferase